ncbi:MAG: hypothetical protein FJY85_07910, partial [Deltaproteobacteria bacterium]|nr:hypothetical protein [Deltaproteobacteria bacterium]
MPVKARIEQAKWMRVFIPLIVLTLYFAALSRFLLWLLPGYGTSVNAVFADNAWKVSLALAVLYVIFFVLLKLPVIFERYVFAVDEPLKKRIRNALAFESKNRIEKLDWILILLPLTPTVQYILNNQDILSPLGSLYVFAVLAAFSVIPIFVVPTSLRATGSTKTLMILGMAFAFTITNMASLSAQMHWLERGILVTQLFVLGAVLTVGWVLYNLIGRKSVYLLIGIFFVANSVLAAVAAAPNYTAETMPDLQDSGNELMRLVGSEKPLSTPNIYLLIYDAYVANETMVGYGIDNGAQEEYLETMGFRIYPHTYSIGPDTLDTMSRVFNASTEFYGSPRRAVSGDGVVQNLLKRFGYETCYVSWSDYVFQGIGSSWDFSFPRAPSPSEGLSCHELVTKSISMGEFRFDVSFDTVPRNQYLQLASSVFRDVPEEPRFVYMHHDWPNHSQLSGVCRPDETARYENKLFWANLEMKQHVEEIIHNDPGAIVVVAGDHGPYL